MRQTVPPPIRRPPEVADAKPEDGAVRLCILAAFHSNDPASAGLLIASAYSPPPLIRRPMVDQQS
ncbi:MAG TPA: hypothetical protein VFV70_11150 [Hyphomonadaceae bacterium]|nr:hypothetical protein [Hyphomonadaceae bacterium]